MPYCKKCQTIREGNFCFECGEKFATGDVFSVSRTGQVVNVTTGSPAAAEPARLNCPLCGRHPVRAEAFDCVKCGKKDLCLSHFDAEYKRCEDCAALARGAAANKVKHEQAREKELAAWRVRAEQAESEKRAADAEVRRLKDKLEKQEARLARTERTTGGVPQHAVGARRGLVWGLVTALATWAVVLVLYLAGNGWSIQKPGEKQVAAATSSPATPKLRATMTPETTATPKPAVVATLPPVPSQTPTVTPTPTTPTAVAPTKTAAQPTAGTAEPPTVVPIGPELPLSASASMTMHFVAGKRLMQTFIPDGQLIKQISVGINTVKPGAAAADYITLRLLSGDTVIWGSIQPIASGFNDWLVFKVPGRGITVVPGQELRIEVVDSGKGVFGWKMGGDLYQNSTALVDGARVLEWDFFFRINE